MSNPTPAYVGLATGIVDPKIRAFVALLEASKSAADWLCDTPPGTDQRERGELLREALAHIANPFEAVCPVDGDGELIAVGQELKDANGDAVRVLSITSEGVEIEPTDKNEPSQVVDAEDLHR